MTLDAAARSHVVVADDSAAPAAFAMLEALPSDATATAIILTPSGANSRPAPAAAGATLVWVEPTELDEAIAQLHAEADTVAYVNGERHLVRDAVEQLAAAGMLDARIHSKSYWRRDQPNAEHGEPARG
jgi:NADPH-dependent ferric siderophore reductase